MLSAVTDIPQTILFGRSPAGENATGHSDTENYYNMVEKIQKLKRHWGDGGRHDHSKEFIKEGKITTAEQYASYALKLIQMPCEGHILGYATENGQVCRYNMDENIYVVGHPKLGIASMSMPERGFDYFEKRRDEEGA